MKRLKQGIKRQFIKLAILLLFIVMILTAIPVGIILTTTYAYNDGYLSREEIMARYEQGEVLHCVQTSQSFIGIANGFECFDTLAEADAFNPHNF